MKKLLIAAIGLLSFGTAYAQTVNPNQIRPGTTNQCLVTVGGVTTWASCTGASGITSLTGDATATGPGAAVTTVVKVNGVSYSASPATGTFPVVTGTNTVTYGTALPNPTTSTTQTTGDNTTKVATDAFVNSSTTALGAILLNPSGAQTVTQPVNTNFNFSTSGTGQLTRNGAALCANDGTGGGGCESGSTHVVYLSESGCAAQNSNPNLGGGTPDTACINSLLAPATAANPILLIQDGFSFIDGNGIQGPKGGGWAIKGLGGGISQTDITGCTISGGVATFTTKPNSLIAGQGVTLNNFTTCTLLNNSGAGAGAGLVYTVSATGLSSAGFQITGISGSQTTVSETATAQSLTGTGFFLSASSTGDVISNGVTPSGGRCDGAAGTPPARGSNYTISDLVINGNKANTSQYCFNIDIENANNVTISNIVSWNAPKYHTYTANTGNVVIEGSQFVNSSLSPGGIQGDGIHTAGPANDHRYSNNVFTTNDNSIALNATEGFCGPISRIAIANSTFKNAFTPLKIYNDSKNVCGNGLVPLIDTVGVVNFSGSSNTDDFVIFGGAPTDTMGTLNPAITNVSIDDSTVNFTNASSAPAPITVIDNLGTIAFHNFTVDSLPSAVGNIIAFDEPSGRTGNIGTLSLQNTQVNFTPNGSGLTNGLFSSCCSLSAIGTLSIDGFGVNWYGGSYTAVPCLLCQNVGNTIGATQLSNIDYTHITELSTRALVNGGFPGGIMGEYKDDTGYGWGNYGVYLNSSPTSVSVAKFVANGSVGEMLGNGCAAGTTNRVFCLNSTNQITGDSSGLWTGVNLAASSLTTSNGIPMHSAAGLFQESTVAQLTGGTAGMLSTFFVFPGTTRRTFFGSVVQAQTFFGNNCYFNGTNWIYDTTGICSAFRSGNGIGGAALTLSIPQSGTAGATIANMDTTGIGLIGYPSSNGPQFEFNPGSTTVTFGTNAVLQVNPVHTADNAATVQITTSAPGNKALVLEATASQTANMLEVQASNGSVLANISAAGLGALATGSTVNSSLICTAAGVTGCATGTVTSIATTGPITGGTITTTGTIACATCLTATAPANHGVVLGAASQALGVTAAGASNAVLIGQGSSADPIFSATPAINCTNCTNVALASSAANTVIGNFTSGSAVPTANSIGACFGSVNALNYTLGTGFSCNTAINAFTLGGLAATGGGVFIPTGTSSITPNAIVKYTGASGEITISSLVDSGVNITTPEPLSALAYLTATNCSSSASPAVCGSAAAGSFVIAAASSTVTVNTSAVTANSQITIQPDTSLGTKLSVTCNTSLASLIGPVVTARTPGTSFAVSITGTLITNPACYSYTITN